jgi:hypothetical protein
MGYKNICDSLRGKDIRSMIYSYPVYTDRIEDGTVLDRLNEDYCPDDNVVWMTEQEMYDYGVPFEAADMSYWEADECVFDGIMKMSNHYLVYASGCRWNGADGYKFADDFNSSISRSYDASLYLENISRNGKIMLLRECSHDVPMGSDTAIIALTDAEYDRLRYAEFGTVRKFAMKHMERVAG